jgi:DNA polymerase-3 subunit chi
MTEVDFYVLGDADADAALRTACDITQKAWSEGLHVYLLSTCDEEASRMDNLLWTFRQDSFVPHERWHGAGDAGATAQDDKAATSDQSADPPMDSSMAPPMTRSTSDAPARVLIGTTARLPRTPDLLINLGAPVPAWFARCPRVVEIVAADLGRKASGRQRYRAYREQGVPLRTHEV